MDGGGRGRGVANPRSTTSTSCSKLSAQEERVYRLRCVEGWSMVVPWIGYSLAELIRRVEPTGNAKFVEFTTLADPKQMPACARACSTGPYVEGLRMDEAMQPRAARLRSSTANCCRTRTARRCACRALEVRLQERKSIVRIRLSRSSPDELGARRAARVRLLRTSTRRWTTRAGARRASAASARTVCSPSAGRRRCSTATRPRSPSSYAGMDLQKFY